MRLKEKNEMGKYEPQKFINAIDEKTSHRQLICPYCGGTQFNTPEEYGAIIVGKEMSGLSLGPNIPVGMLICTNCGHIDFFALGALNLLEKREEKENADK